MANQGCIIDAQCNASLVYCFAVRGFYPKADSLIQQSSDKYGKNSVYLALGALARAAAARGDTARLITILRQAVDSNLQLQIPFDQVFDIIWQLASRSSAKYGFNQHLQLIEQMLEHMCRPRGFFRYLFREIERHIANEYYYTAVALLDDTKRIQTPLENQKSMMYLTQMRARFARQMIRNKVPMSTIRDVANRLSAITINNSQAVYDDLLYNSLMFRNFTLDERMDYFSALVDTVDTRRKRPHIMLPLLTAVDSVEERLKILFRCKNLGYNDISQLDIQCLIRLILQPLYDIQPYNMEKPVNKMVRVLMSFGVPEKTVWRLFFEWSKIKEEEELINEDDVKYPKAIAIKGWLKRSYHQIFEGQVMKGVGLSPVAASYERLQSIVESRDANKVLNYINLYGWPEDIKYEEILPDLLDIVLEQEDWKNVMQFLKSLSSRISSYDQAYPVKNWQLLRILRRFAEEGEELNVREVTDLLYELKRMFPQATHTYESFMDALDEYNRLFTRIFDRIQNTNVENIDECIYLVRTLVKLELIILHPNETLTTMFINHVLRKISWEEAVNTWMKFQSGLNCSNGIVALLRHSMFSNDPTMKANIQYVTHKAQNFISSSRVHLLHIAVMLSHQKEADAKAYFINNQRAIDSQDCRPVLKLMNALKIDEDLNLKYAELCLEYTDLKERVREIHNIIWDSLRFCEERNLASLGLRLFECFKKYGVSFSQTEKQKLWRVVARHSELARRWIYEPDGLLRIRRDDEIAKNKDIYRIGEELRIELEQDTDLTTARETGTSNTA